MEKNLTIKWYNKIDSTNLQAHRELADAPEGTVWVADYQTAGRGQRGNSWESVTGKNLLFTVLLRPESVYVADQFLISQITALAIVKYLETKGLKPKIKWPNDIYINDRKICGILIEHTLCGDKLSASILGIGININQTLFESDAPNPTSLLLELHNLQELDRRVELKEVLVHLFQLYGELRDCDHIRGDSGICNVINKINEAYLSYLYRINQLSGFIETESGTKIMARIKGINRYGCLVLEKEGGTIQEYAFQQIRYII